MAMLGWVMMGLAIWHYTIFMPDRFWGGIVGAFLGSLFGADPGRLDHQHDQSSPNSACRAKRRPTSAWSCTPSRAPCSGSPSCTSRACAANAPAGRPLQSTSSRRPRPSVLPARAAVARRFRPTPPVRSPSLDDGALRSPTCPPQAVAALRGELGVSDALAQALVRRGLGEPAQARAFLDAERAARPRRCSRGSRRRWRASLATSTSAGGSPCTVTTTSTGSARRPCW